MGGIDYPSNIICTWIIDVDEPISIYFEQHDLALDDSFTCITSSNDFLQVCNIIAGDIFCPSLGYVFRAFSKLRKVKKKRPTTYEKQ